MTLETGALLNHRYRIHDILGQGGMGSVYRAMDENLGVEVAVKENLFTTDEYARQFRLEAVILASLRHPNLTRVTDHFVIDGQGQYLVMDYIEGEDLRQRMEREGTIKEEDAILIGSSICDALAYLHTRKPPVLHRDIKPGNVKITPDSQVFLVDFGLAKLVQGSQTTTTGARAMTPGYSPPEQYGTARTDPRSDIYSLAATLYAALTGVIPEDGLGRVMDNVQLTPIRKHNPAVSRRLAAAIEKAMDPFPDERFQTAAEFRRALLNSSSRTQRLVDLETELSVSPPPADAINLPALDKTSDHPSSPGSVAPSSGRILRRKARRYLSAAVWIGVVLLALVSGILISSGGQFASLLPPALAAQMASPTLPITPEQPLPTPTPAPGETPQPTDIPTLAPTALPTPIGGGVGEIAFVSMRTGLPQIYVMDIFGKILRQVTNESQGACQPDWSPDGSQIVYVSPCKEKRSDNAYQGASLYIVNNDGSDKRNLPASLGGDFEPAWSPDGKRIAFTSLRDGYYEIYMYNLETNQTTRLTKSQGLAGAIYARMPAWSPFGSQLVYVLKRQGLSQIWVTTDGDANLPKPNEQLVKSGNTFTDFLPVWTRDGEYIVFSQTNLEASAPAWLMSLRYEERAAKQAVRLPFENLPVVDVSFSPDGQWLVYESWPDVTNHDIYIASVTGASRQRLTTDPSYDFDPVWRPVAPVVTP